MAPISSHSARSGPPPHPCATGQQLTAALLATRDATIQQLTALAA